MFCGAFLSSYTDDSSSGFGLDHQISSNIYIENFKQQDPPATFTSVGTFYFTVTLWMADYPSNTVDMPMTFTLTCPANDRRFVETAPSTIAVLPAFETIDLAQVDPIVVTFIPA